MRKAYAAAAKKLDMGKSCLRFESSTDLLPDPIGALLAATTVDAFIAVYEASRAQKRKGA